ncbi:hypothetical protein [Altererythrobacter sp.]|uniref:hypothetical protein n=1 Tax=Altererythrobacter sp. TaxID=1872480 RepID=UPI003CFEABD4
MALPTSSCGTANEGIVELSEIAENPQSWDGKVVQVSGWLVQCQDLECHMVATKAERDLVYFGCPGERCDEALAVHLVGIGGNGEFDEAAKLFLGERIILTATVDAQSWSHCLDRCGTLDPIGIRAFSDF